MRKKVFGIWFIVAVLLLGLAGMMKLNKCVGSVTVGDAEVAVASAFETVVKAQSAGANVTDLIARLNMAAVLLSNAERASDAGNVSEASRLADQCVSVAEQISADSFSLEISSGAEAQRTLWFALVFSVLVSVAFVLVLSLAWRRFRSIYVRKLKLMRPRVVS